LYGNQMAAEVSQSLQYTFLQQHTSNLYKAKKNATGEIVAIKQLLTIDLEDLSTAEWNIDVSQRLQNEYIVKHHTSFIEGSTYFRVTEYCSAGSVTSIMRRLDICLTEAQISRILYNVLHALAFLHENNLTHRKIAADKILLDAEGNAKLRLPHKQYHAVFNGIINPPHWLAPEVIIEESSNCVQDIWSVAITAIQMAEGNPPLHNVHPMRALFIIASRPPPTLTVTELWTSNFNSFLACCLKKKPENRFSAKQALNHQFIGLNKHQGTHCLKQLSSEEQ